MKDFIFFLFRPAYWFMSMEYSQALDDELKKLLETNDFENITWAWAEIGELQLWIQNHPYNSFTWCGMRPSRRTIYEANKKLGDRRITDNEFTKQRIELLRKISSYK